MGQKRHCTGAASICVLVWQGLGLRRFTSIVYEQGLRAAP